jgi:hypothetical protein
MKGTIKSLMSVGEGGRIGAQKYLLDAVRATLVGNAPSRTDIKLGQLGEMG